MIGFPPRVIALQLRQVGLRLAMRSLFWPDSATAIVTFPMMPVERTARFCQRRIGGMHARVATSKRSVSRKRSRWSMVGVSRIVAVPGPESLVAVDPATGEVRGVVRQKRIEATGGSVIIVNGVATSIAIAHIVVVAKIVLVIVRVDEQVHQQVARL